MADDALLYRWQDLVKSPEGPPDPVLRFVCIVVGSWCSDPRGPEATVSLGTLSDQVGLGKGNLRERIHQLEDVWLDVDRPAGKRPVFRPRIPDAGATVPTVRELRERRGEDVDNSPTPLPRTGGVRKVDPPSADRGWGVPWKGGPPFRGHPDTYSLLTSSLGAGAGPGAPEGPAGAAPGPGGDQLPMPRLLSRVVEAGKDGDQDAIDDAIQQMKEATGG